MPVRAKMQLLEVNEHAHSKGQKRLTFHAVCDDGTPDNQKFAKYTPSGKFEMTCNNPAVLDQLQLGKTYYFDITPVPEPTPA